MWRKGFFFKMLAVIFKSRLVHFAISLWFLPLHAEAVWELISNGAGCNNFFLYEDALVYLDEAIKRNPSAIEAYKERALSYFELGKLELALEDYHRVVNKTPPHLIRNTSFSISEYSSWFNNKTSPLNFAKGLLQGTLEGGKEETIEFISSIRGGLSFLWAFVCSPVDVSKELIDAVYAMGEFLAYARIYDLLEVALPELMECRKYWETWSDYTKGYKMGYIIGKYSIVVFSCLTVCKGVDVYNQLRRANIMATLERCSLAQGARILQESSKRIPKNMHILKKSTTGSIVAHNPNVVPHVLQKKHRWDKFVHLTGNEHEDFKKIIAFLEEIEILKCEPKMKFSTQIVQTYKYSKDVGNHTIVAVFDVNKGKIPLLKDAWVKVRVPYAP